MEFCERGKEVKLRRAGVGRLILSKHIVQRSQRTNQKLEKSKWAHNGLGPGFCSGWPVFLFNKKKKKGGEEGKGDHVHTEAEVGIKSLWKKVCSPRAMRSYNKQGRFLPWSAQRERGSANTSVIDLTPEHRKKKFLFMRPFLHGNVIQPV